MKNQILLEAQKLIQDYYHLVDIKKTKGFSVEPNKEGNIPGRDNLYVYPSGALELQKQIMLKNNELIEHGMMDEYSRWLIKYEQTIR